MEFLIVPIKDCLFSGIGMATLYISAEAKIGFKFLFSIILYPL